MAKNVDVYLRAASMTGSQFLTRWPVRDLDELIETIKQWGVGGIDEGIGGQFALTDIPASEQTAYFEIVVDDLTANV